MGVVPFLLGPLMISALTLSCTACRVSKGRRSQVACLVFLIPIAVLVYLVPLGSCQVDTLQQFLRGERSRTCVDWDGHTLPSEKSVRASVIATLLMTLSAMAVIVTSVASCAGPALRAGAGPYMVIGRRSEDLPDPRQSEDF